jgi:hypothetical protein
MIYICGVGYVVAMFFLYCLCKAAARGDDMTCPSCGKPMMDGVCIVCLEQRKVDGR